MILLWLYTFAKLIYFFLFDQTLKWRWEETVYNQTNKNKYILSIKPSCIIYK